MRLLIINYEYPPVGAGAATFNQYLVDELSAAGYTIAVLTSKFGDLPQYEKVRDNVEIFRVISFRKTLCQCTIKGLISFIISGLWNIDSIVGKFKPEICLNFFGIPCGILALYIKKKYNIPFVLCLRGGDVPGFSPQETSLYHRFLKPINLKIWKSASRITANSRGLMELAYKFYSEKQIEVIYNGINMNKYYLIDSVEREKTKLRLLFAGRLTAQKNLRRLFEYIIPEILRKSDSKKILTFTIVGDGSLKKALINISTNLGYSDKVEFIDWLDRSQLPRLYNSCDLLIFPSLYEGMSNVIMEAKACGLPVAAFNIAGNAEMLEPDRDIIVNAGDDLGYVEKICEFIKSLESVNIYKKAPSSEFKSKFGMKEISEKYKALLLSAKRAG